jgi:uncharacterized protein HemY
MTDARFGWSESRKKSLDQAAELANRVLAINDKAATAYSLLGRICLMKKEYEKANDYNEKALSLSPNASHIQRVFLSCPIGR